MYSLRNKPEKLAKGSLFCLFLKLVQINFIFTDNVHILYIYPTSLVKILVHLYRRGNYILSNLIVYLLDMFNISISIIWGYQKQNGPMTFFLLILWSTTLTNFLLLVLLCNYSYYVLGNTFQKKRKNKDIYSDEDFNQ